jgi:uncharacterized membrane protein YciS (DUF1049 family)
MTTGQFLLAHWRPLAMFFAAGFICGVLVMGRLWGAHRRCQ